MILMMKYNVNLKHRRRSAPQEAGKGKIEVLAEIENVAWQTRGEAPSEYEVALTDALEDLFGRDIDTLPEIVAALNDLNLQAPDGSLWTEESFQIEIKRLGTPFA